MTDEERANTLTAKLRKVQAELKVPKTKYNKFGGFYYRDAESILEAAKPLCIANGLVLYITDHIVVAGERYYVKATASVSDDTGNEFATCAYAREPEEKKGMDSAQVTGSTSSYARKYALNGLFDIDDTKDPDTDEHKEQTTTSTNDVHASNSKPATEKQLGLISSLAKQAGYGTDWVADAIMKINTSADASAVIKKLQEKK
jgi:hypothetical protein